MYFTLQYDKYTLLPGKTCCINSLKYILKSHFNFAVVLTTCDNFNSENTILPVCGVFKTSVRDNTYRIEEKCVLSDEEMRKDE